MKARVVEKGKNKRGKAYALIQIENGKYLVYGQSANYDGKVRGGIRYTWVCEEPRRRMSSAEIRDLCNNGLEENEARLLYTKRIGGKIRY